MKCIKTQDGVLTRISLANSRGLTVDLLSFGACMKKVSVPIDGGIFPLSLTFAHEEEYTLRSTGNCGKTLAPNAGEIGEEIGLSLTDGTTLHPTANRGGNSLHGGAHAGNVQNWRLLSCGADKQSAHAAFSLTLPDGWDGWPGNRRFTARYTLDESDTIRIDYAAETDRPTYINMSHHAYWNLEQAPERAMEQLLFIDAVGMYYNDDHALPCRLVPCDEILRETGIDFRRENRAGSLIQDSGGSYGRQIALGGGIDNGFLLRTDRRPDDPACVLTRADRRISLALYTDAPAVVVYQAGGMKPGIPLENGSLTGKNCAIALEAQEIPNLSPVPPLLPDRQFTRTIQYRIRW